MKPARSVTPWLFMAPALAMFGFAVLLPMVLTFGYSFTEWNGFGPMTFVGLDNYLAAATDPIFRGSFVHVCLYIAATLVHLYRGGDSDALRRGLAEYVERAASTLPAFAGRIALVVDASLSTLGYGERQYCCVSQSWALALVLRARCPDLAIHVAGGRAEPPVPEGATDLVTPLLDALAGDPDVVAIVTDGYENRLGGELERVIAALPRAGVTTPVIVVNSKFTHKDDLALRRPTTTLSIDMWHEHDFAAVLETIGAAARNDVGRNFLTRALAVRLSALENQSWTLQSNASP
jgi:hypothetical protein